MSESDIFNVDGKVALITGGRRGIGKAMAMGLARAGAKLAIVAKSDNAEDTLSEINSASKAQDCLYIPCDLTDREARSRIVEQVVSHFGQLDILVNNAGIQHRHQAVDYPQAMWDMDIELLLNAVMDLSQQAARQMLAQGRGHIVHVASISSFQGARNISAYATAKHAIVGLTKCLANEWASQGINVNAIAPGLIETDMAAHVFSNEQQRKEMIGRIPCGRFGSPEDLVGPLLFLCSEASRHVHGHTLLVDGGWMGR